MPLLHSSAKRGALQKLHSDELREEETLLVFLDDTYVVVPCPDRTKTVYATLQEAMFSSTGIRINPGKTKIWNAAGVKPSGCGVLQRIAETYDPSAVVWRGSELFHTPTRFERVWHASGPDYVQNEFGDAEHWPPKFFGKDPSSGRRGSVLVVVGPLCSCTRQLHDGEER